MPWWRESDTFADDPAWEVLAGGNADLEDRLRAAYCRMKAASSRHTKNGYLTAAQAKDYTRGRRRVLELLCTATFDEAPLLHRKGDTCECLDEVWRSGFEYRIHRFLWHNPSKAEYERDRAQKNDRDDARLRELVRTRDAGCCRYCRSGPLSPKAGRSRDRRKVLQFDHVDPDQPAGPDGENYVVACGRCNEFKGRRTPDEADMVLLQAPSEAERAEWSARPRLLLDRPPYRPNQMHDQSGNNAGSNQKQITEQQPAFDPTTDPNSDPPFVSHADPADQHREQLRLQPGEQPPDQPTTPGGNPPGSGRVGRPVVADNPAGGQPVRPAGYPDVYHRRSRASPNLGRPPIPEETWPPGSSPSRHTREERSL